MVSIIVPVYQTEKYLEKCVESLIQQTYKDIEIILVDDGSTDNCKKICNEFAKADERIKVIHQTNAGLSAARNSGIKACLGEYVMFIDSDDYIAKETVEKLVDISENYDCDVAQCGVRYICENSNDEVISGEGNLSFFSGEEALELLIDDRIIRQIVHNKLYKKELIELFPVGKINEDEFWTYKIIAKAKKIGCTDEEMDFYRQQPNSIMHKKYKLNRLDALEAKSERLSFIEEHFENLVTKAKQDFLLSCFYQYQLALKSLENDELKKARSIIEGYLPSCQLHGNEYSTLSVTSRFFARLSHISFGFTCRLRNILKIGL